MSALRQEVHEIIDEMTDKQLEAVVKPFLFEVKSDPFYSEENQETLRRRIANAESGGCKFVVKTIEELKAMENE
jgi:hypothetical protein